MNNEKFVYVICIAAMPEIIWKSLLDGGMTRQSGGRENVSHCMPGSKREHRRFDKDRTVDLDGKVVECIPPRRLVLTWAEPADAADTGKHTRVAIDLEAVDDMVRLAVTHDEFIPGSDMWRMISSGWPRVLSSLKSFLETSRPLNTWA